MMPTAVLLATGCAVCRAQALTRDDVLSIRDGRFYLDGEPFAEISFNKFDLFWQIHDQLVAGNAIDAANPLVQAQDKALRNLREMGFRSIRIFALPWGPSGPASYADAERRKSLYAALDRTVELCERHGIGIIWSLGAGNFTDTRLEDGKWVFGEEQQRELIADPASRGRRLLYEYIDETVDRYKGRKAVLMWEISNEVTLSADIGDADRIYNGERMPTLLEVARFFQDVAGRIKAVDPLRLVSSGGSNMRESQWHLYHERNWQKDTFEQQLWCFDLLYSRSAVDVMDIHSYPNHLPGFAIMGEDGRETWLDTEGYMDMAAHVGKPLMIGELGVLPVPRTERTVWDVTPDYFETMEDAAAAGPWVSRTLDSVVEAGVQLTYWWAYQSDRPMDQEPGSRWYIDRDLTPELMALFIDANQHLKAKLGVAATQ